MQKRTFWLVLVGLVVFVALGLYLGDQAKPAKPVVANIALPEQPVSQIQLSGPAADPKAELSGLAWYDDNLILLPQYPDRFADGTDDGSLFYLPKSEITSYLDGSQQTPLDPRPIKFVAPGLIGQIPNYQGFESIGFSGELAFFTIEAGVGADMQGYLVSGTINSDLSTLTMDTSKVADIQLEARSANHADEALLMLGDKVLTFFEVNGKAIVAHPEAHVFDHALNEFGTIPMPNIEYRLTDTALASDNAFWGINYFYPGDTDLAVAFDPLTEKYGTGKTHAQYPQVERLVKFQYSDAGITFVDTPPVMLTLTKDARNWEGLALLDDRGFLLATDTFPTTILAFVPKP